MSNRLDPDHARHFVGPDLDLIWVKPFFKVYQQTTLGDIELKIKVLFFFVETQYLHFNCSSTFQ